MVSKDPNGLGKVDYVVFQTILVCICVTVTGNTTWAVTEKSVQIYPVYTPIYFSKDITLMCIINAIKNGGNSVWYRLPNTQILAVNNNSRNTTKFDVKMHYDSQSRKIYQLTIKKFAPSDLNYTYRCDSGFEFDTISMQLNEKEYIAIPNEDDIQISGSNRDNVLNVTVVIQHVYPVPFCSVMFQGKNLTNKLKVANEGQSMFFKTTIRLEIVTTLCGGRANFTCSIGKADKLITQNYHDICEISEEKETKYPVPLIIIVCSSMGFLFTACGLMIYYIVFKRRQQRQKISKQNHRLEYRQVMQSTLP